MLISDFAYAFDLRSSTLSPSIKISGENFQSFIETQYTSISREKILGHSDIDIILNPKTSESQIQQVLVKKVFRRIGEGHTVAVFSDQEKRVVLKIPFVHTSLNQEDRSAVDNNFFLSKLDTFLRKYAPEKLMESLKRVVKYFLYKMKGSVPDYEVLNGYEIAQKHNFKSVVRSRVVTNFSSILKIKVMPFFRLALNEPPRIIINEFIDSDQVLINKIQKAMKEKDLEMAKSLCKLGFKQQLALWKEGGYDLDLGINMLDNVAIMPGNEPKLIDAGSLTDDKEKAHKFILEKRRELKQIYNALENRSLSKAFTSLAGSHNGILFTVIRMKKDFPGDLGEEFVLNFLSLIDDYFTVENLEQESSAESIFDELVFIKQKIFNVSKRRFLSTNPAFSAWAGAYSRMNAFSFSDSMVEKIRNSVRRNFSPQHISLSGFIEEAI